LDRKGNKDIWVMSDSTGEPLLKGMRKRTFLKNSALFPTPFQQTIQIKACIRFFGVIIPF
jgi:hypothetical protein